MKSTYIILKEFIQVLVGLMVFSYGVHLIIAADIGVAPWDCLGQGIANHSSFNYGIAMTLVSILVLLGDLLLREPIGYGMIFDGLLTGNIIQFFNDHCSISNTLVRGILQLKGLSAILACCLMIVVGIVIMSFGQAIYMSAGETCGPRDTLTVGLGKRFPGVSIGLVQNAILLLVLLVGWALGGSVGIGTIVNILFVGLIMNAVFRMLKFDPRTIRHRSIVEATKLLVFPEHD